MHCCRERVWSKMREGFVICGPLCVTVDRCSGVWISSRNVLAINSCLIGDARDALGDTERRHTHIAATGGAQNKNNLCIARWHVHLFKSLLCMFCVVGISRVGKHQCVCVGSFFKSHFQCEMNSARQQQPERISQPGRREFFLRARALVSYCEKWKCSSFVRDYAKRGAQKARRGDEFISAAERARR